MTLPALDEAETRTRLIDPALHARGWTEDLIRREETLGAVEIVDGRPRRQARGRTDYTLRVRVEPGAQPVAVAILEAKSEGKPPAYGFEQAKEYGRACRRLHVPFLLATNGHLWVLHDARTGKATPTPQPMETFPTPDDMRAAYEDAVGIDLTSPPGTPAPRPVPGRGDEPALLPGRGDPCRPGEGRQRGAARSPQPRHGIRQDVHRGQPPAQDRGCRAAASGTLRLRP